MMGEPNSLLIKTEPKVDEAKVSLAEAKRAQWTLFLDRVITDIPPDIAVKLKVLHTNERLLALVKQYYIAYKARVMDARAYFWNEIFLEIEKEGMWTEFLTEFKTPRKV
jgi:hypothetical protein